MSFESLVYNVMIASPSDVAAERDVARDVIFEWNVVHSISRHLVLLPLGWETHASPAMGTSPQEIINRQLLHVSDLLVGIFWTRIGTATSEYASGTVEEIEKHIEAQKPVMLYFSSAPVRLDSVDSGQYEQLKQFRDAVRVRGLCDTFSSVGEFREKFTRHLQLKMNQDAYFVAQEPTIIPNAPAAEPRGRWSREALILLKAASQDRDGVIRRMTNMGGTFISVDDREFVPARDHRALATWDAALRELERADLLEAADYSREIFRLTRRGYELADKITL